MELRDDKDGDKQFLSFRIESNTEILSFLAMEKQEVTLGKHPKSPHTLQPFQMVRLLRGPRRG